MQKSTASNEEISANHENGTDDNSDDDTDDEEDEEECRVCRGPAEPDRPLYHPCRCLGSIGLVHQECLVGWLSLPTRLAVGDRCELCSTPFVFNPRYADGALSQFP